MGDVPSTNHAVLAIARGVNIVPSKFAFPERVPRLQSVATSYLPSWSVETVAAEYYGVM